MNHYANWARGALVGSALALSLSAGVSAQTLVMSLDLEGVSASSGAACSSGSIKPSHVALAMNLDEDVIKGAVRFSFGPDMTAADIDRLVAVWSKITERLKKKG